MREILLKITVRCQLTSTQAINKQTVISFDKEAEGHDMYIAGENAQ